MAQVVQSQQRQGAEPLAVLPLDTPAPVVRRRDSRRNRRVARDRAAEAGVKPAGETFRRLLVVIQRRRVCRQLGSEDQGSGSGGQDGVGGSVQALEEWQTSQTQPPQYSWGSSCVKSVSARVRPDSVAVRGSA